MSNEFINFFVNIGRNTIQKISTLAEQFQCEAHDFLFVPREYPVSEQFVFDANVNIKQAQKIFKPMAPNESPGIDKMPLRVIKDCLSAILPSITSIINATFLSAQFPNAWKIAEVTPINRSDTYSLTLLGKEIIPAAFAKDLGVILDPYLTYNDAWNDDIASTTSSCMARLVQINRVKNAFDTTTLTIIINALVFSKLY